MKLNNCMPSANFDMQRTNINVSRAAQFFRDRTYLQLEVVVGKYCCKITQYLRNNERNKKIGRHCFHRWHKFYSVKR